MFSQHRSAFPLAGLGLVLVLLVANCGDRVSAAPAPPPPPPEVTLDAAGTLTLTSTDDGCTFLMNRFARRDQLHFDLGDGNGLQSRFYPIGTVKNIVFTGGEGFDMVWIQSPIPGTFTSAGSADSMFGAQFLPAGKFSTFNAGEGDVVGMDTDRDVLNGTGATVVPYP